jgi:hypothetical protein
MHHTYCRSLSAITSYSGVGSSKNKKRKQSRVVQYRVSGCILKTWNIKENKNSVDGVQTVEK